jgi:cyclophilin family peptidyl-prolyl cis-trans isomerase
MTKDMIYNMKARGDYNKYRSGTGRPYVWLEFSDGMGAMDRVVIELFNDIAPLTAENFRCLCTGERGEKLSYKGKPLHRVVKNGWLQGGDIENGSGAGGYSIYGGTFADESFSYPHDSAGIVGMANQGPHSNASQFYMTLKPMPCWDHKYVAFGRVIEGMRVLKLLEKAETSNDRPTEAIIISDCGQLEDGQAK